MKVYCLAHLLHSGKKRSRILKCTTRTYSIWWLQLLGQASIQHVVYMSGTDCVFFIIFFGHYTQHSGTKKRSSFSVLTALEDITRNNSNVLCTSLTYIWLIEKKFSYWSSHGRDGGVEILVQFHSWKFEQQTIIYWKGGNFCWAKFSRFLSQGQFHRVNFHGLEFVKFNGNYGENRELH